MRNADKVAQLLTFLKVREAEAETLSLASLRCEG